MAKRKTTKKTAAPRGRHKLTRGAIPRSRRDAKYENAASKLSPEDRLWGDPPDEPRYTEEEEFASLYRTGMKPANFADKAEGRRYRRWLAKLEKLPTDA